MKKTGLAVNFFIHRDRNIALLAGCIVPFGGFLHETGRGRVDEMKKKDKIS